MKINLGSGGRPLDGYVNVDVNKNASRVDVVWDLDKYPWPFEDGTVDEVFMDQCLEHLDDHNRAMKEIYRILKTGGIARISVPHFTWQFAFHDPTHKHFYGYNTFFYYAGSGGYFDFKFTSCKVKIVFGKRLSVWNILLEPIFNLMPNVYEQSPLRIFPALTVDAVLIK